MTRNVPLLSVCLCFALFGSGCSTIPISNTDYWWKNASSTALGSLGIKNRTWRNHFEKGHTPDPLRNLSGLAQKLEDLTKEDAKAKDGPPKKEGKDKKPTLESTLGLRIRYCGRLTKKVSWWAKVTAKFTSKKKAELAADTSAAGGKTQQKIVVAVELDPYKYAWFLSRDWPRLVPDRHRNSVKDKLQVMEKNKDARVITAVVYAINETEASNLHIKIKGDAKLTGAGAPMDGRVDIGLDWEKDLTVLQPYVMAYEMSEIHWYNEKSHPRKKDGGLIADLLRDIPGRGQRDPVVGHHRGGDRVP